MKKWNYLAPVLLLAVLAAALWLPQQLLSAETKRILSETRTVQTDLTGVLPEEETTLAERLVFLSDGEIVNTWLPPEMVAGRYGSEADIAQRVVRELETLFPGEPLVDGGAIAYVDYQYYYRPSDRDRLVTAVCSMESVGWYITAELDLPSQKVIALYVSPSYLSYEDAMTLHQEALAAGEALAVEGNGTGADWETVIWEDVLPAMGERYLDGGVRWGDYLGLEPGEEVRPDYDGLESRVTYTAPDGTASIVYEFQVYDDYLTWSLHGVQG